MLYYFFLNAVAPSTIAINQNAIKIKNITFAIDAAPAAIPVKPKIAATIAMIRNVAVHLSIKKVFKMNNVLWSITIIQIAYLVLKCFEGTRSIMLCGI